MPFNRIEWHFADMLQVRAKHAESVIKKFMPNTCNGEQHSI